MFEFSYVLAAGGSGNNTPILFFYVAFILVFWLFIIRPQSKKTKAQKKFISEVKKGDKVVTTGGIHGVVNRLNDDDQTVQLEVSPGSYLKIDKVAINIDASLAINKPAATTPAT